MSKITLEPLSDIDFAPTREKPVQVLLRCHQAQTIVAEHCHHWGQMVYAEQGVIRVYADNMVFTVPPLRAVWIDEDIPHRVEVLTAIQVYTVHIQRREKCHTFFVPPLLREIIKALSQKNDMTKYHLLVALFREELKSVPKLNLGIEMPLERRLLNLCNKILIEPRIDISIEKWSDSCGASVSTIQRLFKQHLHCSFNHWRQQVLLARAIELAGEGYSLTEIAFELGYSSQSAFTLMISKMTGIPAGKYLKNTYPKKQ
ncbi:helix-turn-helix domain-containing protein [Gallibacterium anatis]|uniref:helix-turn-helix domain-containing protein n=1 Tax=Gallibacterium anatis TaxID=750 RepID=UPI00068F68D5|nr:helix-turn-helix transcriptional regulator [Gallibacterium anatis]WIM82848.1 helix-turn-helix transcriptional regulator [Gallibacterium anatis]